MTHFQLQLIHYGDVKSQTYTYVDKGKNYYITDTFR